MATLSGVWRLNKTLTLDGWASTYTKKNEYSSFTSYEGDEVRINYTCLGVTHGMFLAAKLDDEARIGTRSQTLYEFPNANRTGGYQMPNVLDFGTTPQTVSESFYNWFIANATQLESTQTVSISGKWIFNDKLIEDVGLRKNFTYTLNTIENINFTLPEVNDSFVYDYMTFTHITDYSNSDYVGMQVHSSAGLGILYAWAGMNWNWNPAFLASAPRIIDFGETEQFVTEAFYEWITANAIPYAEAPEEPTTNIYKFDTFSQTIAMDSTGAWFTSTEGYYYAVIPLEVGKAYKVALQNVTTLSRFRRARADSNVLGEAELSFLGYTDTPKNGDSLTFVATTDYLICYGGTANGGEVLVTCMSAEEPSTATVIIYNGNEIASLEAGQTATIKTAETEVEHDIVVKAGSGGGTAVESTHALYNVVKLPTIPEDVLTQYPYCWIRNNTTTGYYDLLLSDTPFYWLPSSAAIQEGNQTAGKPWYRVAISTAETVKAWANNTSANTFTGWGIDNARTVLWSNHDIPNGSATATDIYFEGTEPAPIEEEPTNAIEITYNSEIIASLEAGQTATIKTANTKIDHDIVVSAKAEEESFVGTWVLNDTVAIPAELNADNAELSVYLSYKYTELDNSMLVDGSIIRFTYYDTKQNFDIRYIRPNWATNIAYSNSWTDARLKSIHILSEPTSVDFDFATWLKANATKQ